jgi:hypothetical protein
MVVILKNKVVRISLVITEYSVIFLCRLAILYTNVIT